MKNKIKTIIFDLGGVVINDFGNALIKNASKKLGIESTELRLLMNKYENDLQKGKINHVTFWKLILNEKNKKISDEILINLWKDPYEQEAEINSNVIDIIYKLKNNYKIGCISNTQEPHISINKNRGLFNHFEILVLSSEVNCRKPEKKIFDIYLDKAKCSAKEAVLVDDDINTVSIACSLGMRGICYREPKQLIKELIDLGIKNKLLIS